MNEMPSPILIIGDHYLCNKNILASKKKYKDYEWVTMSASDNTPDEIRSCAIERTFLSKPKIVLIQDLPNQKAIREFLINLAKSSSSEVKFVIWDSEHAIKIDPKTRTFNKTWGDFIKEFKLIKDSKFIDNGSVFSDKEDGDCVNFVIDRFKKYKKSISKDIATSFMNIVGKERSYITSEIEKLCISAPQILTLEYIEKFTYPSSKEAILYKFNNSLDGSYESAIVILDQFLGVNINSNVLAEILMKKARWQLAAAHLFSIGISLEDIPRKLMQMGKFPSVAWHSDRLSLDQKKRGSESFDNIEKMQDFMFKKMGVPQDYFHLNKDKSRAETIPMDFMAIQMVNAMSKSVILPCLKSLSYDKARVLILDKYLRNYLFISEKLKEIRFGGNPIQELYEMISIITDRTISEREQTQDDEFSKWN